MPHKIFEGIAVTSGSKPWLETHTKQGMSKELNDEQNYLRARKRFPNLSFNIYCKHRSLFEDEDIQAALPSRDAVKKYLDKERLSLCKSLFKGSQEVHLKQGLHELLEKGPVDEGDKDIVASHLDYYLVSISSDVARQVFSSSNLYGEAIKPLLARYPEIMRESAIQLTAALIEQIGKELKDDAVMLASSNSIDCPQLRCLIDDPELSRFLHADQLEVATKMLEEAAKLYNNDADLYDYLEAAYDRLNMQEYYQLGAIPTSRAQLSC
jgi:hypothetical protein